jgi:hypothetical protein
LDKARSWSIPKLYVWDAYKRVKANRGAAGVDDQTIEEFERDLANNLYKLWNRMSSGSYFPPPVKRVNIEKRGGGFRPLGIPTVSDRIAQGVVKGYLEPELEKHFHPDSYGYRPGKSALDAVGVARERCWRYAWVLDLDIRRRSSTARMMIGGETQRTNHSISSAIAFEPEDRRIVLESSSSISVRESAMLQRKQFERKFAGGSCVVVLISG